MQATGIIGGVVSNAKDLFDDPKEHSGHLHYLEHSGIGRRCYNAPSYRLIDSPPQITMPTPCLGYHTQFVCHEISGMDNEKFINLF